MALRKLIRSASALNSTAGAAVSGIAKVHAPRANQAATEPQGCTGQTFRRPCRGGQRVANEARQQQAVESAERLRGILAPMAAGGASLPAMASALEAAGVKTATGKSTWAPTQVKRAVDRLGLR